MTATDTDILVVGAGPVGLACATLAATMGARVIVVDGRRAVSHYPKARAITVRSMEIFRQLGLERAIRDAMPAARTRHYALARSLVDDEMRLLPFGMGDLDARDDTPCLGSFCTQDRLEPILERRLRREPLAHIRFATRLTALAQDQTGVMADLSDVATGKPLQVRAKLLVGADGAQGNVAAMAGIERPEREQLDPAVTVIFRAPLAHLIEPLDSVYLLLGDPASEYAGLVSGVPLARDPNEWSMVMGRLPAWGTHLDEGNRAQWRDAVRRIVGISDLEVEITGVFPWRRSAMVPQRLRLGRIVLAGDSCHLMPPAGGLGMNTGLTDAHNLAWRLAAIAHGANLRLLDEYEAERRPEIVRAVAAAVANYRQGGQIASIWHNPQVGLSLGMHYERGTFCDEGPPPPRSYPYHDYRPEGRPGGRAPHFWLNKRADFSVLDLFGQEFVLLSEAPDRGIDRIEAALRHSPIPVRAEAIGRFPAREACDDWRRLYGVRADGLVLVRPDGVVAWRGTIDDWPRLLAHLRRMTGRQTRMRDGAKREQENAG